MRYLLTDLNSDFWRNFNFDIIQIGNQIDKLNKKDCIGETIDLNEVQEIDFLLKNASHGISDLELFNKKIFGNIEFLNTNMGNLAKLIKEPKFAMRASHYYGNITIFGWDIVYSKNPSLALV